MYYEEQVIDGVLCSRGLPDGKWEPLTAKQLTDRLLRIRTYAVTILSMTCEVRP